MDYLYNLRDWLYECDRFLFLAEVHYRKSDVIPSEHKFNCDFSSRSLEKMFSCAKKQCEAESYYISFDTCISKEDFDFFKKILDGILSEKWSSLSIEDIIRSQEILNKLARNLTDDIGVVHESKGYPSLRKVGSVQ
jgi:hypothetical protein